MRYIILVLQLLGLMTVFAFPGNPLAAAEPASAESLITVDRLFGEKDFDTETAPQVRWSKRSAAYFTLEKPADGTGQDLVRCDPSTGAKAVIVPAAAFIPKADKGPLKVEAFDFSDDESQLLIYTNSQRVWRRNTRGDYWVLDLNSRELRRLGGEAAASTLMFAKFSPDGTRVAYVRENNLYVQDVRTLAITALTIDGSKTLINGTADWVNEEELRLRDCFRWSPDGGQILFWQFDTSGVSEFHLINNVESDSPHITSFAYPKVGGTNSAVRLGVVSSGGGPVRWLNLPGDPREHFLPHAEWSPDGSRILVQQFNRLQTELRVWLVEPQSGEPRAVLTETDAAWLENENPVRWMDGGNSFLWLSERTGWRQAYRASVDGAPLMPITQAKFDVIEVRSIDETGGWLYYDASPDNPTQRYLFRTKLDGSQTEQVSPAGQPGQHRSDISPDAQWAIHTWSNFSTPPVVELVRLNDHATIRTLIDNQSLRDKLSKLKRPQIEFFQVDIGDGVTLDGWCLKPPEIDDGAKLPLVMHVYGEPHDHTVQDAWPGRRGLWHWMLAQQGFVVASVDNRGTNAPRGREWRKAVHRQIGILAPDEQARAVRELLKRWPFIDPTRVGSWGWSGGGSMSLHAVFRYPDLYRTAIAVAPMADQRLYDTIYQERYMGLPADNPNGFRDGSPLTHAHQLRGNLLLVHGTGDDNCHYQATERLIDALVKQGKHFTVLPYPNRTHAVKEGENTERHLWGTMARYLRDNLQSPHAPEPEPVAEAPKPRPKLQIINGTDSTVDIFWLKTPNERAPNGSVEPGKHTVITTTLGHRFAVVSRGDQSESIVTSEAPVQAFRVGGVPAFYTQRADAEGFPVVASAQVNPYALREAVYLVNLMLAKRPDVRAAMIKSGARLCIIAHNEFTTDLPEWAWLADEAVPGFDGIAARDYRDARARGMGGSATDPFCSCAEENLLAFDGDPYSTENILIHELAHNIHLRGMSNVDPTFDARVKAAYEAAMTDGLWKGKYAAVNHHEYFAEGVQSWFDDNRENDHDHNHVNTRAELLEYDPRLAALCREVFGDTELRYTKPATRLTGHLAGYDPQQAPKFVWPPRLQEARKRIRAAAQARSRAANAPPKPLKVFILAGQSNMQGHAKVETFDYIGDDPTTAPLLTKMRGADGQPRVCDRVWISYFSHQGDGHGEVAGRLTAGFGARRSIKTDDGKIGPEFTFGITLDEALDEPILIIKTAWGGKSLHTDFRPPSAGPYRFSDAQLARFQKQGKYIDDIQAEKVDQTGRYYHLMLQHVKTVLADIRRVCPEYDPQQGYELAGFVWLQGWNDLVDSETYPERTRPGGYATYSELMAHFIRDVRKDLNAPRMPFVIGVLGVGGERANAQTLEFRKAMAAPAAWPEFQGNVVAVQTAPFWSEELAAIAEKRERVSEMARLLRIKHPDYANKDGAMTDAEQRAYIRKFEAELISPAEAALWLRGASNQGYHYLGCAKTFALMGQAFANALLKRQ